MMLVDTNVLVYAHNTKAERHKEYSAWLQRLLAGPEPYGVSDHALTAVVRVITDPRLFIEPTPLDIALRYAESIRFQQHAHVVAPGARFWQVFSDMCGKAGVRGKLVPDAYLAALAVEHGCEFVTTDKDFSRFPGLRFRHPLN